MMKVDNATGDISFYEDLGVSPKFFWDASAESLGIGTSSPSSALTVQSDSGALFSDAGGSRFIEIVPPQTANSFVGEIGTRSSHPLVFNTVNTERLRIDASGNVGIGTSSPLSILHIGSGADANIPITIAPSTGGNAEFRNTSGTGTFTFTNNNGASERLRITSAGNVGIGTTTPNADLELGGTGEVLRLSGSSTNAYIRNTDGTTNQWYIGSGGVAGLQHYIYAAQPMTFHTSGLERARIDASGNLLVGNTEANPASGNVAGVRLSSANSQFSADGATPVYINRKTSDGTIIDLRKNGTTVGVIGSGGGDMYHGSSDTGLKYYNFGDAIHPYNPSTLANRDNAIDLGLNSIRFQDIYATNGTIQTSDRNEKQDIEALSDAEQRVAVACKGLLRKFRWKSSVEEKGDDARIHFGIIAQDLQAAFDAEGLDAGRYAMFISSTWTDEETGEERSRMGVRYPQLLAFIIAAI
jgi:hypothetical protein